MRKPDRLARLNNAVIHMLQKLARHIELPAQLANKGNA